MRFLCVGRIALFVFALSVCIPAVSQTKESSDCKVNGFSSRRADEGVNTLEGTVESGKTQTSALLFQPSSSAHSTPILFSHESITVNSEKTSLISLAKSLAKRGATVLVLERTIEWEPRNSAANRERRPVTCAFDWLVQQSGLDLTHFVYLGPRLSAANGVLAQPFGALLSKGAKPFWVPVAETEGKDYTDQLMSVTGQDFLATRISKYLQNEKVDLAGK